MCLILLRKPYFFFFDFFFLSFGKGLDFLDFCFPHDLDLVDCPICSFCWDLPLVGAAPVALARLAAFEYGDLHSSVLWLVLLQIWHLSWFLASSIKEWLFHVQHIILNKVMLLPKDLFIGKVIPYNVAQKVFGVLLRLFSSHV